jgi:glycosyltransferase involved in cell wall biosynthesis
VPGLLVAPDDPAAFAAELRRWLTEPGTRQRLRASAHARRAGLHDWPTTARILAGVLERLPAPTPHHTQGAA